MDINKRNIRITAKYINEVFEKADIDRQIEEKDIPIYQNAFTHSSYIRDNDMPIQMKIKDNKYVPFQEDSNEVLEFHGDSVICSATVNYLCMRYPNWDEGKLTKLKTEIVSRTYLAKFARYYGFQKYLLLDNNTENKDGRNSDRLLEDAFESFVGSLFRNKGEILAKNFVMGTIDNCVNFSELLYLNKNYKERIMHYLQRTNGEPPVYEKVSQIGNPITRTFICKMKKNRKVQDYISMGYGRTKQEAEKNAAFNALKQFRQLTPHELHIINSEL